MSIFVDAKIPWSDRIKRWIMTLLPWSSGCIGLAVTGAAWVCVRRRPPKNLTLRIESPSGYESRKYEIVPSGLFRWKTRIGFDNSCDVRLDTQLAEFVGDGKPGRKRPLMSCYQGLLSKSLTVETAQGSNGKAHRIRVDPHKGISNLRLGRELSIQLDPIRSL